MITIVNYQMGNIGSVAKKIKRIGYDPIIATTAEQVLNATKLILPGVGHFSSGVFKLKELGLWDVLHEAVIQNKTPILGICLGMQLMAKHSEEGDCEGLGWFDAEVKRFNISDTQKYKVPHMGWNTIKPNNPSFLFKDVDLEQGFYFVHSYHVNCNDEVDNLAISNYSYNFTSVIQKQNIYGVQFHPEKSHEAGEALLKNFIAL